MDNVLGLLEELSDLRVRQTTVRIAYASIVKELGDCHLAQQLRDETQSIEYDVAEVQGEIIQKYMDLSDALKTRHMA